MASVISLSHLPSLLPHLPCGQQQPVCQLPRYPISQHQNPLLAQQAQFPLPLPLYTPAPATQNQQSVLHPVLSQKHHHQRPLWSCQSTTHSCEPISFDSYHTQTPTPKTALALRRLLDYNKEDLKER